MSEDSYDRERWHLLQNLRSTVEGLLTNGVPNVWNVYGGLNRLHNIMEKIFKHGCRTFDSKGEPECWTFIEGLNWLQPSLATSPTMRDCDEYHDNLPTRITSHKDILWLYKSLEEHSLSLKLSWLLSDKKHLHECLEPWAFLCQDNLAEATLICLKAVEKNQPALLTEIDPSLSQLLPHWSSKDSTKRVHRRSSSYPVNLCAGRQQTSPEEIPHQSSKTLDTFDLPAVSSNKTEKEEANYNDTLIKTWSSFPEQLNEVDLTNNSEVLKTMARTTGSINREEKKETKDKVQQSIELSNVIKVDYSEVKEAEGSMHTKKLSPVSPKSKHTTRKSRKFRVSTHKSKETLLHMESSNDFDKPSSSSDLKLSDNTESIKIFTEKPRRKKSVLAGSAPEFSGPWILEVEGQKDIRTPKKSFIEDGGSSVLPMSTGYFPTPKEGQSLTSFLSSAQFSRANAELDRENAHFSISEAMIAAIEQLKCNRQLRLLDENAEESDQEINDLKQRIRLRRRQRQEERRKGSGTWGRDLLSDGRTDTTTTDQSISPTSTSSGSPTESISTDDVEDYEIDDTSNLSQLKNSGLSVSMASLYSEADLYKSSPKYSNESNLTDSIISAEGVALALISRFSQKHLPRASDLKWLVSEQDAPQQLLPLPKSWPISPDDAEGNTIPLRGTIEWAPPRPQIIFTPHLPPVRKILIAKQNYRCAGCGMKVAVQYASKFRYCEYLGRYFCTGCHTNQVALIPGRILSKWDFNRYPVSNFSYRLLDQMTVDPLFQVNDLNPMLYRRIKQLNRTKVLRMQLFYLKDFLFNCRFASNPREALKAEPSHLISEPHIYSIQDFTQVKTGILPLELNKLVQECCKHVTAECVLCQARGFVCELCNSKEIIYPWELSKVTRCDKCGSCYHTNCINPDNEKLKKEFECKRCHRLRARREIEHTAAK